MDDVLSDLRDAAEILNTNGNWMWAESVRNGIAEIERLRAAAADGVNAGVPLAEAARPFAACVFNDNGDVTISTGSLGTHDWLRLDRALKEADALG